MNLDSPHKLWSMAGDLNYVIVGSVIKDVWLPRWNYNRYKKGKRYKGQVHPGNLVGWCFSSVEPHGKSLLIKLENFGVGTRYIGCNLGQGQWMIKDKQAYILPWSDSIYMVFHCSHQDGYDYQLLFYDRKKHGKVEIREHLHEVELLNRYGPAIDSPYFSLDWVTFIVSNSKRIWADKRFITAPPGEVKPLLMRQEYFAGVTNKMASEICFLANIHPRFFVKDLRDDQVERLYYAVLVVFGTFSRINKKHDFMIFGKILCPVCESKVEFYKQKNNRTYYCPKCQDPDFREPQPITEEFVKDILTIARTMEHVKSGAELQNERVRLKRSQQILHANVGAGEK